MKIHEYQAKELFKQYGIKVPFGKICCDKTNIANVVECVGAPLVVKAQVHSGARGKAGGVKLASTNDEAIKTAENILGMTLVSSQAGEKKVNKILVEKAAKIKKEFYLSITFNRAEENVAIIFSTEGGMDIEEVSKVSPEKILKKNILPYEGYDLSDFVKSFGQDNSVSNQIKDVIEKLLKLYVEKDASLVEINPLVLTEENEVIALDAKINFDDNALFRHQEIVEMTDESEENPLELEAKKDGLNYIKLDGTIGCMVNGAGLAMATMDIIKLAGKNPANFLDVGGGAGSEKIAKAFKILLSDKNVKAVFINIFGGILRCDLLAEGITSAAKMLKIEVPLIIRMEGTNKEIGAKILQESGIEYKIVKDLDDAIEVIKEI